MNTSTVHPDWLTAKDWLEVFKNTIRKWNAADPFRQSAVIAYYAIFSLPALLLIVISVAGFFFGHEQVTHQVLGTIYGYAGKDTADQVQVLLARSSLGGKHWYALIIGVVTTLTGAIGVFTELQKSLNYIYEVAPQPKRKFLKTLRNDLFSLGLILSIGFLLLVSLVITALLTAFAGWIGSRFTDLGTILLECLNFGVSFVIITVLFALLFKILPDARIGWRHIWSGAGLTAFLFTIGKHAMGLYFGKFQPASAYGVAGSIVLILLWVSYSSMILFFGAEFIKQLTLKRDGKIEPAPDAVVKNRPDGTPP